jgi:cytochrome P450
MSHTLLSFVVGLLIRPEIQKMAQEELDTVTGKERLPTLDDRPRLPFTNAVCREVTRWRPAGAIGELLLDTHLIHAEI